MIAKFKNTFIIILFCLINVHLFASTVIPDTIYATVVKVVDGDTVHLKHDEYGKIKVRLADIDAPEKDQPFGKEATNSLSKLISGKLVKFNKVAIDKYNRIVGLIYYKETEINYYLVRNGLAWSYDRYNRRKKIRDAENIARKEQINLWSKQGASPIPPWEWRRMRKTDE